MFKEAGSRGSDGWKTTLSDICLHNLLCQVSISLLGQVHSMVEFQVLRCGRTGVEIRSNLSVDKANLADIKAIWKECIRKQLQVACQIGGGKSFSLQECPEHLLCALLYACS